MAAGDVLLVRGTPRIWDAAGTTEQLDMTSKSAGYVGVGSYHDYGTAAKPDEYEVLIEGGGHAANVSGQSVDLYIAESDDALVWTGPQVPADNSDGAGSTENLPNLKPAGSLIAKSGADTPIVTIASFRSASRYLAPVQHNNTSAVTSASGYQITITPIYYQSQSA